MVTYVPYTDEALLPKLMALMEADLSEPYSVFTYRYFLSSWPHLTLFVMLN
jgi:peptide alpha-N-acetyltransferase